MTTTQPGARVWVVEPDDDLRAVLQEVVPAGAELMETGEFRRRLQHRARPDALLIDGTSLAQLDGEFATLGAVGRTLVLTARGPGEIPKHLLDRRDDVEILLKPFPLEQIELGVRWLVGSEPAFEA